MPLPYTELSCIMVPTHHREDRRLGQVIADWFLLQRIDGILSLTPDVGALWVVWRIGPCGRFYDQHGPHLAVSPAGSCGSTAGPLFVAVNREHANTPPRRFQRRESALYQTLSPVYPVTHRTITEYAMNG
jgi:hypothetical protein